MIVSGASDPVPGIITIKVLKEPAGGRLAGLLDPSDLDPNNRSGRTPDYMGH